MELRSTVPIKLNTKPVPGSVFVCTFKLKGTKERIKIDIGLYIYYKKLSNSIDILSSVESVDTDIDDKLCTIKLNVPYYDIEKRVDSYLSIFMHPPASFSTKIQVEDISINSTSDSLLLNNVTIVNNNVDTIMNNNIDIIRDFVIKGYKKVLLREPDPNGLQNYVNLISSTKLTRETFLFILKTSEEYIKNFGSWITPYRGIKLIENNKIFNRPWFFGLPGTWWWEMTEEEAIKKLEEFNNGSKLAIASIVRNEERNGNLRRFLDCCQELEHYHNNIIYIFVEGDSIDKTYDILKNWVDARDGSILEKVNKGTPQYPKNRDPKRTIILGELRNRLIEIILSKQDITEVLMIDASYGWKADIITSLRETNADIAAPLNVYCMGPNQKYIFYDTWAYRKNGKEFRSNYPYAEGMAFDRPIDIDCVGGGYLIRRAILDAGIRYGGSNDTEHFALCKSARDIGFSIKINPKVYIRKGGWKE